ncbi:MAG TPA: c-type cytochrome [Ramlibacter sp.]|uniref:c-type cytochrome n=1 Tax=Ramlibacter sp. TaxID=1917967 RepID=UPI002ED62650
MNKPTLPLALVLAAALVACGKSDESRSSSSTSTTTSSTTSPSTGAASPGSPGPTTPSTGSAGAAPTPSPSGTAMAAGGAAGNSAQAGQGVYSTTCVACHGAGVAGAPKLGDKADWGPRVAQGNDTLYQHALNGFTGKKGTMPPKGGNTALPDPDVRAAVDYMVSQAR